MKYSFGTFVRHAIAAHLRMPDESIEPVQRLREDLRLLPLDLVLITLSLEDTANARFPAEGLEGPHTVEELSRFYWSCQHRHAKKSKHSTRRTSALVAKTQRKSAVECP